MKTIREQLADKCVNYKSPIHNTHCKAGHNYRIIAGGERAGYLARLPCVRNSPLNKNTQPCSDCRFPTESEIDKEESIINGMLEKVQK